MEKKELHWGFALFLAKLLSAQKRVPLFLRAPSLHLCTPVPQSADVSMLSPLGAAGDRPFPGTSKAALRGDFCHLAPW